jgi:hypothetical protein
MMPRRRQRVVPPNTRMQPTRPLGGRLMRGVSFIGDQEGTPQ